ncbi:MAG: hypothetical protein R2715_07310 [Ilumatobacteraceae bacterium]
MNLRRSAVAFLVATGLVLPSAAPAFADPTTTTDPTTTDPTTTDPSASVTESSDPAFVDPSVTDPAPTDSSPTLQIEVPDDLRDELGGRPGVLAVARSPFSPGGVGVLAATVVNPTDTALATPVRVSISGLPAAAHLAEVSDFEFLEGAGSWTCDDDVCELVDPATKQPIPLAASAISPVELSYELDPSSTVPESSSVAITLSAGGVELATETVVVTNGSDGSFPGLVEVDAPAELERLGASGVEVSITNTSSAAFVPGAVRVTGLTPDGSIDVASDSVGWHCDDAGCTTTTPVASGDDAPILRVTFLGPDGHEPGEVLTWTTIVELDDDGTARTFSDEQEAEFIESPAAAATLTLTTDDLETTAAPATLSYVATVSVDRPHAAPGDIAVTIEAPGAVIHVAPPDGWTCDGSAPSVRCVVDDIAVLGRPGGDVVPNELTFDLAIPDDTPTGSLALTASLDVPGSHDVESDHTVTRQVEVVATETAQPMPLIYVASSAAADLERITDGSPVALREGGRFGFGARNVGSAAAAAGDVARLRFTLPTGLDLGSTGAWTCETTALGEAALRFAARWDCTADASGLGIDEELDPLELSVERLADRRELVLSVPATLSVEHRDAGEPTTVDFVADLMIDGADAAFSVDASPVLLPTGGPADIRIALRNDGDASGAWRARVTLPLGVELADDDGCRAMDADHLGISLRSRTVICEGDELAAGATATLVVPVHVVDSSTFGSDATIDVVVTDADRSGAGGGIGDRFASGRVGGGRAADRQRAARGGEARRPTS